MHYVPTNTFSGLDEKEVQTMHYVKDSKGNWYYDDKLSPETWYYYFVTVAEGTNPELVEQMIENMKKEDYNLENDVEVEDTEEETSDDEDVDYDSENDNYQDHNQKHSTMDLSEVLNGIKDPKRFMTQKFDAQDLQFQEFNRRFDTQEAQIQEMRQSVQKWEDLGCSIDAFFASSCPNQDEIDGTSNPNEPDD